MYTYNTGNHSTFRYLPMGNENIRPLKDLCTDSIIIHNSSKAEPMQASRHWLIHKQTVIHLYNRIVFSTKKKQFNDAWNNVDESQNIILNENKNIILNENKQTQKLPQCVLPFVCACKQANLIWSDRNRSVVARVGDWRLWREDARDQNSFSCTLKFKHIVLCQLNFHEVYF
jgi:hypothetical protein